MAAAVSAGEVDVDVCAAAAQHNAVVVSGNNKHVGIVGWATGGGKSC
jgi:hypothetical protein